MSKPLKKDAEGRLSGGKELPMPKYRYQSDRGETQVLSNARPPELVEARGLLRGLGR